MLKWGAAFVVSAIIVVLATLPPFLPVEWRTMLMLSFSKICHQIPERSPHIAGISLGVCHRCYGVYLGLPLAAIAFLFLRSLPVSSRALRIGLFSSLGLLAIDWGAPLLDLWHNTTATRTVTGLLFGLFAGFYLVRVIDEHRQSGDK